MKKIIILANQKMYSDKTKVTNLVKSLKQIILNINIIKTELVILPSFIHLPVIYPIINNIFPFIIGAQNISLYKEGAYTGEVSCNMIKDYNVKYTLIGHSERRYIFNETNQEIYNKGQILLNNNIIPVLCIGETLYEYKHHMTPEIIRSQLKYFLSRIKDIEALKLIIAYEPVWAIGTNKIADIKDINYVYNIVVNLLHEYKISISENIKFIYGGSINEKNISNIINRSHVDGVLIGKSSSNLLELSTIYKICNNNNNNV